MTKADKRHWIVVLVYGGLLCLSLVAFLKEPKWEIAFAAQLVGPTFGTFAFLGVTLM